MSKVRFLATSDWHSNLDFPKNISKYVNLDEIDFIIFTGDLSDKSDDFTKLLKPFKGKRIFMVPGNHETKKKIHSLKEHYNIHMVGNSPIIVNSDLAIFGSNYLAIGPNQTPDDEVLKNIIENYKAIENIPFKIHLAHLPPVGTVISDSGPYYPIIAGVPSTRVFLEHFSPDVTFVGHIHETSGLEEIVNKTKVINLAETFKVFEFDSEKKDLKEININSD